MACGFPTIAGDAIEITLFKEKEERRGARLSVSNSKSGSRWGKTFCEIHDKCRQNKTLKYQGNNEKAD
jgi:hypothetical protein